MEVISRASKTINGYDYTLSPTDKKDIYELTRSTHVEIGDGSLTTTAISLMNQETTSILFCDVSQKELNKIYNNIDFAFELLHGIHCGKKWYVIIFTLDRPYDKECYPNIDHYKIDRIAFATPFGSESINLDYAFDTGKFIIGIDYDSNHDEHSYYRKQLGYDMERPYPLYKALIPLTDDELGINNKRVVEDVVLKMFAKYPTVIHCFDDVLDRFRE